MPMHEYFEELCALVPIGQLSPNEFHELSEHLKVCGNCRHATEEFSLVLDQLPIAEVAVDDEVLLNLQGSSYRDRFLRRARIEGIPLSDAVAKTSFRAHWWRQPWFRVSDWMVLAAATALILFSSLAYWRVHQRGHLQTQADIVQPLPRKPVPSSDNALKNEIAKLQDTVATLEGRTQEQQRSIAELENRSSQFKQESESAKNSAAKADERLGQMKAQLDATNASLAAAKSQLANARNAKDASDAALVAEQFKLTELSEQLKDEHANAERDRQLTAASQEVRDLMGARNLHIIDVSDVDSSGKSKKSFGRVFFTEGKSLIFYAFDLGHKGNASKVSFQAWGQWEGQDKIAKNLGVFYVDDTVQRRWVLKVDDPNKLKNVNALFVTVEPLGGAERPTGKKLLYAYLGTQANHP